MNRLAYSRAYLCGAMDRASDNGVGWRQRLREELKDLKVIWLDPTCKPIDVGREDLQTKQQIEIAKQQGDFDFVAEIVKPIRCVDLRMVDIADWQVVNIDLEIHACGTYEELFLANREKKPIIVHVEQGKPKAPGWLFATIPHAMIFSTWDEIYTYLRHVAYDAIINRHNRWYFFDFTGEK